MSFYLVAANRAATLGTDDPVIRAADVAPLRAAANALNEAGRVASAVDAARDAALSEATAQGHAEGHAAGTAAAAAEARATLFDLTMRAADERGKARAAVAKLALEVVRRIAGQVGDAEMVAALADRAANDLLPETVATVRVAPAAQAATAARLASFTALTVVGDAALDATDCLIETPLGVSHAGLDVQLAAVERTWATAAAEAPDAR